MKSRKEQADVNSILDSLDGMQRAEPSPFFYTRLSGRLQEQTPLFRGSLLRPALAIAVMCLLIVLNVSAIRSYVRNPDTATGRSSSGIESFANAYDLGDGGTYHYKTEGK